MENAQTEFIFMTGNSGDSLTWSSDWVSMSVYQWDTTINTVHVGQAWWQGLRYYYNIYDKYIADVASPIAQSAYVHDTNIIAVIFNETIDPDSVSIMDTSSVYITGLWSGGQDTSFTSNYDTLFAHINNVLTNDSTGLSFVYTGQYPGWIQDVSGNLVTSFDSSITNNLSTDIGTQYLNPYQLFVFDNYGWSDAQTITSVEDLSGNGNNGSDGILTDPVTDEITIGSTTTMTLTSDGNQGLDLGVTGAEFYGDDFTIMVLFQADRSGR